MLNAISEKLLAKILSVGAALTTIFIVSGSVTDPVNTPKLVAIGITGFAAIGVLYSAGIAKYLKANKLSMFLATFFVLSMLLWLFSLITTIKKRMVIKIVMTLGYLKRLIACVNPFAI